MSAKEKQGFSLYFLIAFGLAWLCQVGGCMALLQQKNAVLYQLALIATMFCPLLAVLLVQKVFLRQPVGIGWKVQGNVGYIKIWQFDNSTPSELDFALRSLTASGAQSFIFDLRDNGGGILDDAISCIELVAPEGVLAYAEDKAGNRTLLGSSTGDSVISQPTVCLVNENTASAAELFASSLRTLCGTRLVGSTTMGKGTIQSSPQRLSDGSAVVVTVAKLICGDGSCFDGTGLTVDVERPLTADEQASYYDYTLDTDPQIQRAVSTAQQLTGVTTVGGVNDADIAADSAAASSEAAAESTASSEAAGEAEASSEAGAEGEQEAASAQ